MVLIFQLRKRNKSNFIGEFKCPFFDKYANWVDQIIQSETFLKGRDAQIAIAVCVEHNNLFSSWVTTDFLGFSNWRLDALQARLKTLA